PSEPSFCEDFNVANNPFVRARSNIANFEFRCLQRYLVELQNVDPDAVLPLFRAWLTAKASYHARMARCLSDRAAAHERRLARLFAGPSADVMRIERMLMAFRTAVFERDRRTAEKARRAIRTANGMRRLRGRALPKWYGEAAVREVLAMRGRPALSSFRVAKLLAALAALRPQHAISNLAARYWHFVELGRALGASERKTLERLLTYGPSDAADEASRSPAFVVLPRFGTISPWSSKATDIARNCGLDAVTRIERGVAFA